MSEAGIKRNVISGFFWKAMENGGDQLVTFFISIVLARLLGPEKYGTMATMLIFISIANVVVQNGFQTALIQKKNIEDDDISSVFWMGLVISGVLYACIFKAAPFIASFFGDGDITPMLRVLSLILFFGAVSSVEIAIVARRMDFKIQCMATIFADVISGIAGVLAAFNGAGTWALVTQQLIKHLCLAVFLFISLGWKPGLVISLEKLGVLFGYGWKVLASGLIDTIYSNIYTPFISKLYDAAMVGYYNRGNQFPLAIVNSMASTMQAVMLPAFSKTQDDMDTAMKMLRRILKLSSFVMFPVLIGLAAVAESVVMLLLGSEWLKAVPFLRILCFSYSMWHIHVANLQAINAHGRSDIYLKLEIIKKIVGIIVLAGSIPFGITAMIALKAVFDLICTFINAWPNRRLVCYGPLEQWRDILPEAVLALFMGAVVFGMQLAAAALGFVNGIGAAEWTSASCLLLLMAQAAAGVVIYIGTACLMRFESLNYLMETLELIREKRL